MKAFQNKLTKIGKELLPSKNFRDEAKLRLMKSLVNDDEVWFSSISKKSEIAIPSASLKYSFLSSLLGKKVVEKLGLWGFLRLHKTLVSISAFAILFIFTFSIYIFPTSAENKTYINNITGLVEISDIEHESFSTASSNTILEAGTKIRTGENSLVEIVFFEDSIIRLDANTEVEINKLMPNAFVSQIGNVTLNLNFGKIWIKSFGDNKGYSAFEVHSGDVVVLPQKATFDLRRDGNLNTVSVFNRSAKISYRGKRDRETFTLVPEKQVTITLRGIGDITEISPEYLTSDWVKGNLQEDKIYLDNFIEEKKEAVSNLESVKNILISLRPNSAEKYLAIAENNFKNALDELDKNDFNAAEKDLSAFIDNLKKAKETNGQIKNQIDVFIENENKYLQFITPENNLYAAKKSLQDAKELLADDIRIAKEESAVETLWETRELSNSKNQETKKMAVAHLETFAQELEDLPESNTNPEHRAELLDKKSEELQIISDLRENSYITNMSVDKVEDDLISDVIEVSKSTLVRPGFPGSVKHETIEDYIDKIEIYKTAIGQENTMREILNSIDNKAENLLMLKQLKEKSPQNVRSMVTDKMVKIIRAEKQKAVLEAN